jgi:hypothetical protein
MGSEQGRTGAGLDYEPDFVLPRHDVVHEDNWSEYEARGFVPVAAALDDAQECFSTEHIYTGHAFDYEAGRPLRHKPGVGVYASPEGIEYFKELYIEHKEWFEAQGWRPFVSRAAHSRQAG